MSQKKLKPLRVLLAVPVSAAVSFPVTMLTWGVILGWWMSRVIPAPETFANFVTASRLSGMIAVYISFLAVVALGIPLHFVMAKLWKPTWGYISLAPTVVFLLAAVVLHYPPRSAVVWFDILTYTVNVLAVSSTYYLIAVRDKGANMTGWGDR